MLLIDDFVMQGLFIPNGSKYFLAVATPCGEGLEGQHFHLRCFAQSGLDLVLRQPHFQGCSAVLFDWEGKVIHLEYVQAFARSSF
jgi:hypothetical protein